MNDRLESLLEVIKHNQISEKLLPLFDKAPNSVSQRPFELYQYGTKFDYQELQQNLTNEIIFQLNEQLYEQEKKKMEMEVFLINQAIDIEKCQVQALKIRVNAQMTNARMSLEQEQYKIRSQKQKNQQKAQKLTKIVKDETIFIKQQRQFPKCSIYQSHNIDLTYYPQKHISIQVQQPQKIAPLNLNLQTVSRAQSLRKSLASYSKRTDRVKHQKTNLSDRNKEKVSDQLQKIQKQLSFYQRAWKQAQLKKDKKLTRHYKAKMMQLLEVFWKTAQ